MKWARLCPVHVLAGEAEVSLVDEGGGLEGVVGALAAHVGLGEAVQLGIDEGKQIFGGGRVAVMHGLEELGDVSRGAFHGVPRVVLHGTVEAVGRALDWRKK